MTTREKIAHLLRRFGMGASQWELDLYEPLGVDGTIDRLIDFEKVDEGFPISPWEVCFEEGKDEVYLDPYRIAAWWSLRMLMTKRPLEQKLTLFWHNHFAVGSDKVEFGPTMLDYIETLRRLGSGDFATLLKAVSKEPAMMRYLDTDTNVVGHANENFSRELFELFTMGQGNTYTETDVKEAARAFTGWGNRYLIYEGGGDKVQERAKESIAQGLPMIAFCTTPALHDTGRKTILGQSGNFDGDEVLQMVASRTETAKYVCARLWKFFGSDAPAPASLASVFTSSGGQIKAVLREIARVPEFWAEDNVRTKVKSPVDFVIAPARQMNLYAILLQLYGKPKTKTTPLAKPLRDTGGLLIGSMYQMGMLLLYPPNVSGWEWGTAWISGTNMLQRMKYGETLMGVGQPDPALAAWVGALIAAKKPTSSAEAMDALLGIFDAPLPAAKRDLLATTFEKAGGVPALGEKMAASKALAPVVRALFGTPEFQHC